METALSSRASIPIRDARHAAMRGGATPEQEMQGW
jgi:hypothetical protein